jgi:class 3 adenylate cyclase/tetratricopeptide (TPR) repeat protein
MISLRLSITVQGQQLMALLSDGVAMQEFATQAFDDAALLVADKAADNERAAQRAFEAFIPAAIAQRLRAVRTACLDLQLPPQLDRVPWEMLNDGVQRLGTKFAVVRNLSNQHTVDQSTEPVVQRHVRAGLDAQGDLVLLRLQVLEAPSRWATAVSSAYRDIELLPDVALLPDERKLVEMSAAWLCRHGRLPDVLAMLAQRVDPAAVDAVVRHGSALVILPRGQPEAFADLGAALQAGWTVAEAVRRLRVTTIAAGCQARVYGHANRALVAAKADRGMHDGKRQVTALSFDLCESTKLMQQVGDEQYSQLLVDKYYARCAAIVRMHGGVADDPQGDDGAMCYFGFPLAQEDSARRAVRAGLDLLAAVADLGLRIRVGIATGRVTVRAGHPYGESVHLAARLRAASQPGEVVVSDATLRLVQAHFDVVSHALNQPLKDFDNKTIHRVRAVRESPTALQGLAQFVGRHDELKCLHQSWAQTLQGHGAVVLVSGEAGIGKSRLLREFRLALQQQGRSLQGCVCRQEWQTSPFLALCEALRAYLGLAANEDRAAALKKIEALMPPALRTSQPYAVMRVAALLGVPADGVTPAQPLAAERQREQTLDVLLGWFRAAAAETPVCLLVDDAQWADPSTREFLDRVIDTAPGCALMVVLAVRAESQSLWRPRGEHVDLVLRGLPTHEALALLRQVGGRDGVLPDSLLRLLASRADGVPLFLEEAARMAVEMGGNENSAAAALGLDVPHTIEDVLMARLDRLGTAKAVAQFGAVLGREYPTALFAAMLDRAGHILHIEQPAQQLDLLIASGLLVHLPTARGTVYRFKHALVRDVAYQSLWARDRKAIHEAVAAAIQASFPELAQSAPEMLAYHHAQAEQFEEALSGWESAARAAAARSANLEAQEHARQALQALGRIAASPGRDRSELRLQALLASRLIATEGYGAASVEHAYLRAAELAHALDDRGARAKVDLGLEAYYVMRADFTRARALAERADAAALGAPDPMLRLQTQWALANIDYHQGNVVQAIERMDRCLAVYRPEFHRPGAVQDPGVMCLCYSAWAYWERGDAAEAASRATRVIELAHHLGHRFSLGEAYGFAASVHLFRREHERALELAEKAVDVCEEDGFTVWLAHACIMKGQALAQLGQLDVGLREMERGYQLWVRTGAVVTRPFYRTLQAEGELMAGRPEAALILLQEALDIADNGGEHYHRAEILRLLGQARWQAAPHDARARADAQHMFNKALVCAMEQRKPALVLRSRLSLARWAAQTDQGSQRQQARQALHVAVAAVPAARGTGDVVEAQRWLVETEP